MDFAHGLSDRLLLAVPKKGRLNQSCLDLLSGSDIKFHRHSRRDIALVKNLPIALVFLPAADIPTFVGEGRVDFGITGRDQVAEHFDRRARSPDEDQLVDSSGVPVEIGVKELLDLGFGGCKLQVQVPADGSIEDPKDLVGKSVATSFTNLTEHYFRKLEGKEDGGKLSTKIITITGSVETACALGLASGIVDLVESGETMREAGLKPIATVMETSAVLIANKRTKNPKLVELVTSRIAGVLTAQRYVLMAYNIHRSKLEEAKRITPGKRSPTVQALEEDGWVAISVMVETSQVAVVMDQIMAIGGTDILATKIENSRAA